MPLEKQYNRQAESAAPTLLNAVTSTTADSTLKGWGVEFFTTTSTGTHMTLPSPIRGVQQVVVYAAGSATASTAALLIHTPSTATPFMGSTNNTVSLDAEGETATFYGFSTSQWTVTVASFSTAEAAAVLTASTGAPA